MLRVLRLLCLLFLSMEGSYANVSHASALASDISLLQLSSSVSKDIQMGGGAMSIIFEVMYLAIVVILFVFLVLTSRLCFIHKARAGCIFFPTALAGIGVFATMGILGSWGDGKNEIFIPLGIAMLGLATVGGTAASCIGEISDLRQKKKEKKARADLYLIAGDNDRHGTRHENSPVEEDADDFNFWISPPTGVSNPNAPQSTGSSRIAKKPAKKKMTLRGFWNGFLCKRLVISAILMTVLATGVTLGLQCRANTGYYGSRCNAFCGCNPGYTCDVLRSRCYPKARGRDEPCAGSLYPCASGLKCVPWFLKCSDGTCGSQCFSNSECNSTLAKIYY